MNRITHLRSLAPPSGMSKIHIFTVLSLEELISNGSLGKATKPERFFNRGLYYATYYGREGMAAAGEKN